MPRQLHLNAFLMNTGHHEASWRLPESNPYAHVELDHYIRLARTAERGTFDSLFLADGPQLWSNLAQRPMRRPGTAHSPHRTGDGHRTHRPHRHGVHVLQLPLQPGP